MNDVTLKRMAAMMSAILVACFLIIDGKRFGHQLMVDILPYVVLILSIIVTKLTYVRKKGQMNKLKGESTDEGFHQTIEDTVQDVINTNNTVFYFSFGTALFYFIVDYLFLGVSTGTSYTNLFMVYFSIFIYLFVFYAYKLIPTILNDKFNDNFLKIRGCMIAYVLSSSVILIVGFCLYINECSQYPISAVVMYSLFFIHLQFLNIPALLRKVQQNSTSA